MYLDDRALYSKRSLLRIFKIYCFTWQSMPAGYCSDLTCWKYEEEHIGIVYWSLFHKYAFTFQETALTA